MYLPLDQMHAAERLRLEVASPYLTASNKVEEQAGAALGAGISQR